MSIEMGEEGRLFPFDAEGCIALIRKLCVSDHVDSNFVSFPRRQVVGNFPGYFTIIWRRAFYYERISTVFAKFNSHVSALPG
jgi:hypothetical protein